MNELTVQGWVYWETDKKTAEEALREFKKVCEKVGINADNITAAELFDEDGESIDKTYM